MLDDSMPCGLELDEQEITTAKQTLIETARFFYGKNWMPGTSGNLSHRLSPDAGSPGRLYYLITQSGKDKGALTEKDFTVVEEGGLVLYPAGEKSSAESRLHEAVYQFFPWVNAVYHVHTVSATVLSQTRLPGEPLVFSGLEMLKGLGMVTHEATVEIPLIENTQDIYGLGLVLHEALNPDVPGFLLRGHGLYTWGATPFEAKRHVEIWEFLFEYKIAELMVSRSSDSKRQV